MRKFWPRVHYKYERILTNNTKIKRKKQTNKAKKPQMNILGGATMEVELLKTFLLACGQDSQLKSFLLDIKRLYELADNWNRFEI